MGHSHKGELVSTMCLVFCFKSAYNGIALSFCIVGLGTRNSGLSGSFLLSTTQLITIPLLIKRNKVDEI